MTLFGSTGTENIVELESIAAVVNNDVISSSELARKTREIKEQLQQNNTSLPPDSVLRQQVLENLITQHLQLQIAQRAGIRVDDEMLNRAVRNIAAQNNLTLEQFRNVLEKDGYDYTQFRESLRNDIAINRLRQRQVDNRITVSEEEIDNFLANLKAQGITDQAYHLGHILIAVPEAAKPEQIQAAQQKAERVLKELRTGSDFAQTAVAVSDDPQALQGGDLGWRKAGQIPTLFADTVVKMQPGQISNLIRSPSGFHIIKLLEKRDEESQVITQTHARHILIRPSELVSEQEVRERLLQLKQRIEAGEDFATLARSNSEDPGSAAAGGDLSWVDPGTMVPEFEQQMAKLKANQISEPFKSRFGWHIVQVLERRNHDDQGKTRRSKVREVIRQRKIEQETQNWLRQLRDEAYVENRLAEQSAN
ncbi:MAG TPA: molecular chaperone SurA [Gammaproteobacteria bacterium]|nr:molecular chaperone SurA [Gammaproteobacteria bacterium]